MLKKRFLSTILLLLTFGGAGGGMSISYAAVRTVAHVASGQVVLRTGPEKTYQVVTTVPRGEKIQINGCLPNKSWCFLRYKEKAGWASARYINVQNVPVISFARMARKSNSRIKAPKEQVKHVVSRFKNLKTPKKKRKNGQKLYRTDLIIDSTGVKKRDEKTILKPSSKVNSVSVEHVTAYNPLFPDDVNFRNFERNETRYRVVTYPAL
ncbi:uncharacterized protein YraI [Bartonella silvatica]|uniref:Uncharacterized protein YraI n=1 Tax=Bartonella silvatica TaxID=357760 RepID=A0ABV2HHW4_9HYPH